MASSKRTGQVRFEAWVPTSLLVAFRELDINASAWVRTAMQEEVAAAVPAVQPEPQADHRHRPGMQTGSRYTHGILIRLYSCAQAGCDHTLERQVTT